MRAENALKEYIKLLEGSDCEKGGGITEGSDWWTGRNMHENSFHFGLFIDLL